MNRAARPVAEVRRWAWALAAGLSLGLAANAAERSPKTPADWLRAMDHAFRELDYDGVFSYYTANRAQHVVVSQSQSQDRRERSLGYGVGYRSATRLATFRVIHKVVDGVEHERILHLNGPPREILRVGDEVVGLLPPGDDFALDGADGGSYTRVFARRFEEVPDSYKVEFAGNDRVAARSAVRLLVMPKDANRFGFRLWLDAETGLLLRSELHDVEGAHLEIFQFAAVRIGDGVKNADLEPATGKAVRRELSSPRATQRRQTPAAAATLWRAGWVPSGFRMAKANVSQRRSAASVNTLLFTDGLAAFSIFIETMPAAGAGSVVSRNGATVLLTHALRGGGGDHLVTVVGEVPVATARRVASSIYREPR